MRGILIFISCILLVYFVVEKSGILRVIPYMATEGPFQVEKIRLEWHPEKLTLFVKGILEKIPKKWLSHFFKKTMPSIPKPKTTEKIKAKKPIHHLVLNNGAILSGYIIQRNEEGILFQSEGVTIFFHHNEISSLEAE